jgi:hypothetical protein
MQAALVLTVAAAAFIGPLAGMSLDQTVKQLPARRQIGDAAYSAYMRAADLGNGPFLYGFFGVGAALTAIAAWLFALSANAPPDVRTPLAVSALLALLHSGTTAVAAPTAFRQRRIAPDDQAALARLLDRFTRWHHLRTLLQLLQFAGAIWALIALVRAGSSI